LRVSSTADLTGGPGEATTHRAAQIRRVAADLFETSGYSATTVSDIAKASGVLPGSLYHHFSSKEDIAVSLLRALDADLKAALGGFSRRSGGEADPQARIRDLAETITAVSLRHGAALRLQSYEAPSAATDRFRSAVRSESQSLDRAWRRAAAGLVPAGHPSAPDLGLLRFAFQRETLEAAINFGAQVPPGRLAGHLSDLLLRGVAPQAPSEAELDSSAAMAAARAAVLGWPRPHEGSGSGSREDIIAAARIEFAKRGFQATTIRDIAKTAGIWMGTLYRRISSKEELLEEILAGYSGLMGSAVRAVLDTGTSVPESLDAVAYVFVNGKRRFRMESEIVKFEWHADREPNRPLTEFVRDTTARSALLEQALRRGIAEATIRPMSPVSELDAHVRYTLWLPFQDHGRTSVTRAHRFLRSSLLRGFAGPGE
jgi:AcrR family transcriptional regulator